MFPKLDRHQFACQLLCLVAAIATLRCDTTFAQEKAPVDFDSQIRPILTQYCSSCHGGVKQAADLSFVYEDQVLPPDGWVVEPGEPDESELILRVITDDPDLRMPPPGEHPDPVPAEKVELLERWIAEGAKWGKGWSMAPLKDPIADSDQNETWSRQPLDKIVLKRLTAEKLAPSKDAAPQQWLRRVSFDLIGLPPTVNQTNSFVEACAKATDKQQLDALYSAEVDRLLVSKHFGERWASVWMDLARYADSKGFEKDPHRDMWPYRDWLIRAFNDDMPYDAFTIKQLAGDLLPESTADDLVATAFHRNTQTNTEGGTDDEEFRVAAVIDRIDTTWTVWQATTFGCVRCHSHPYDPLKHDEYYKSMALFNNELDCDLNTDYPTVTLPNDPGQWKQAVAAQIHYEDARHALNNLGVKIGANTQWKPQPPLKVTSTGGRLKTTGNFVRSDGGTFPVGVAYTVEYNAVPMSALQIDIIPLGEDPAKWPEQGSLLTQLTAVLVDRDGKETGVEFSSVFADALTSEMNPIDALSKSGSGVGEYPELHRPRKAWFILKEPVAPKEGAKLRLVMNHSASTTGNVATPIRHFRWSFSNDPTWGKLISSDAFADAQKQMQAAKTGVGRIKGAKLPVMMSRVDSAKRDTRLFIRGNWQDKDSQISGGIPDVFQAEKDEIPVSDRLAFARWIVSDANPLAARVWANRIWAQLFEVGIVETLEDFGSSGLLPTNPELLDHLAVRIRDKHDWHLKPFLREIVLSSTYRQTNEVSSELVERDPRNQLLARGPRTRLSAEMIRDQALLVSGLLTDQVGGKSVMPPQPDGVWQTVYSGSKWETAKGEQRYRRALYTYWRRTSPYPSFLTFDSPTRDLCSARRIATNTPLQALVTLNDPVYVECAKAFAENAIGSHDTADAAIDSMNRAAIGSAPSDLESRELLSLYNDLKSNDTEIDTAAMSIVANTILNLDKAFTK